MPLPQSEGNKLRSCAADQGRRAWGTISANGPVGDRLSRDPDSRAATNELLHGLRTGRWGVGAWENFVLQATRRSLRQALQHRRAFAEATALHVVLGALAGPRHRGWVLSSWILAITHLGMIEDRRSIGLPNTLTLIRANLPALEDRLGNAVPALALATDFLDGKISRATHTETRFGQQADFLADAAFWACFTVQHERSGWLRITTFVAWMVPVAAIAAASFAGGAMKNIPRSRWLRSAAALEVFIGTRTVLKLIRTRSR